MRVSTDCRQSARSLKNRSRALAKEADKEALRLIFAHDLAEAFRENGETSAFDAGAFFPPSSRGHYIAMLNLHFFLDDSSDAKGKYLCVMAGWLSTAKKWKSFEEAWGTVLRDAGVDIFHANKFFRRKAFPYREWSDEQHHRFMRRFTKIAGLHRYIETGVGRGVQVDFYTKLILEDPTTWEFFTSHGRPWPALICTHLCLEAMAKSLRDILPPKEQIVVVLENGPKVKRIIQHCHWLKAHFSWASRYSHFCIGTKQCRPLQAADLLVYEARRYIDEQHLNKTGEPVRPSFQRITQHAGMTVGLATEATIRRVINSIKRFPSFP